MEASNHLDNIIGKNNGVSNIQVVYVDIEKYSKRRTSNQSIIINLFTEILSQSLNETAKRKLEYIQNNGINFSKDVVLIPTGDGAAVVFTFMGLHDVHLDFAKIILKNVQEKNSLITCSDFNTNGWCNCHHGFNVRIGVSEGKGIVYKDINGNYNIAGNPINLAARVMNLIDKNQIVFTKESYNQLIDLVENPEFDINKAVRGICSPGSLTFLK